MKNRARSEWWLWVDTIMSVRALTGWVHDPDAVGSYLDGAIKKDPGLSALHRMSELLLAEVVPGDGRGQVFRTRE